MIIADLRELSNQLEGLVLGDAMVLAGGIACNAKLGMNAALPVQMQQVLVTLRIVLYDNLMQHGAHDALLQFVGCARMIPQAVQIMTKFEQPALLRLVHGHARAIELTRSLLTRPNFSSEALSRDAMVRTGLLGGAS